MTVRCPRCRAVHLPHVPLCVECGADLEGAERVCRWCRKSLAPGRFATPDTCSGCATVLDRAADPPVPPAPAAAAVGGGVVVVDASYRDGVAGLGVAGALGRHNCQVPASKNTLAEVLALNWALKIARGRDARGLVFLTDSLYAYKMVTAPAGRRWEIRHVPRAQVREAHERAGRARRWPVAFALW